MGAGKAMSRDSGWGSQFLRHHTPLLEMKAPDTLAELPLLREPRPSGFSLWFPAADRRLRRRWLQAYPAVSRVRFEKRFFENRVIAHLEPRTPLVRWEGRGVDKEGTVFELASHRWLPLPKATVSSAGALPALGRWMAEVSRDTDLWSRVVAVSQDMRGEMWLAMDPGTHVAWGTPEVAAARAKARCLARVLDDAHHRLSGAAKADLRFFDEGRVIVRPKSAV